MIIAVIILSAALLVCVLVILLLKRDISRLSRSLKTIRQSDTNMRATTDTFDKNICELCNTINEILDKQKAITTENEKSNREFRQAITNISHDLRTPLTSAVGYVQMLNSGKLPEEKKPEYISIIEHRLKFLSELMNKLFEYTQILEGKMSGNIEKINLCNVLRDTVSFYYGEFTSKGFSVEVDLPDTVYVMCGIEALKRIFQNLIQNVLTHGTEKFKLSVKENSVIFENKVSSAAEIDAERLFDRFYTADFSRMGNSTGLGLAIVKELVRNMGGEIEAELDRETLRVILRLP